MRAPTGFLAGIVVIVLGAAAGDAAGQVPSATRPGGASGLSGTLNPPAPRFKDPTGKPCLKLVGEARAQPLHPKLFNHIVTAQNSCTQTIRVQVCYFGSQSCVPMRVPGRQSQEVVLGTFPSWRDFRFDYREQL